MQGKDSEPGHGDTMSHGTGAVSPRAPRGTPGPEPGTCAVPVARPRLPAPQRLFPSRVSCREHFVPTSRPRSQRTDSAPAGLLLWH